MKSCMIIFLALTSFLSSGSAFQVFDVLSRRYTPAPKMRLHANSDDSADFLQDRRDMMVSSSMALVTLLLGPKMVDAAVMSPQTILVTGSNSG